MESFSYTRTTTSLHYDDGGNASAQTYYIPYKNALEEAVATWMFLSDTPLELEIGDSKFPIPSYGGYAPGGSASNRFDVSIAGVSNQHTTGGAIYQVAIQQSRFSLKAATEDRYDFSLQFVSKARLDMPVTA